MKKILIAAILLLSASVSYAQTATGKKPKHKKEHKDGGSKDKDGIDGRMKGPNGEAVYIGKRGGKYYLAPDGSKVYVVAKAKKEKKKGKK
jgi:hypothetical protein